MRFAAPQYLWALPLVIILLGIFLVWAWRVKQKLIAQFVQSRLLANLTVGVSPARQKMRMALLVAAAAFAVLAMARPQWGYAWQEAHQQGLDIVVAIDASKSMLAQDVAPNRLARAKLAALDLAKLAKHDRMGLVVFAGTAFLQAPLTIDEEAFRQNVETVDPANMPRGGTDIAGAIDVALNAFEKGSDNHKILVLFTDGEDHETDDRATAAAQKAAASGMRIFTLGLGSTEGEVLKIKDANGNYVKSRLNETLLQKVAGAAGGFYLPLRGPNPIGTLYTTGLEPLPKSDPATKFARVWNERFHWPLALAILCLVVEMLMPERKRMRSSAPPPLSKGSIGSPSAVALLFILLAPALAFASPSSALREYNDGNFLDAQKEYERLAEEKTNDYRLHYNAGTAAYQAKQYDAAEKHFNQTINSPAITSDLGAYERALYNLGNTQYKQGQEKWGDALTNFVRALQLDPHDINAQTNLAVVKRKLEELRKQQQQQQQKDGQNQQDQQQQQQGQQQDQKDQKDQKNQQSKQQQQQQAGQDNQQQQSGDKDKEKEQKQASPKDDKDKKNQKDQAAAAQKSDDKKDQKEEQQPVGSGQMTQQEAARLLDAQQEDEHPLIFVPQDQKKQNGQEGPVKDW